MARVNHIRPLKAYVLLESMFAMIVLMISFCTAIMIYNNVVSSSEGKLKLLARYRIQTEATRSKAEQLFLDETKTYDEFSIEKKISPYEDSQELFDMELKAVTPGGKVLYDYHELICKL